jgi:ATP-binding cassette subfamily F protein 3
MDSVDSLIEALDDFSGAAILVSHDEEIVHSFAKRLIIFDGGKAKFFDGTYQDFLDRIGWNAETTKSEKANKTTSNDRHARAQQILQKSRAVRPIEQKIQQLEAEIHQKEAFITECEKNIVAAAEAGDGLKITEISKEMEAAKTQISNLYAEWESTHAELEKNFTSVN